MEAISIEATIAITGKSRRTWWRRIAEDASLRMADDARGRAMLCWELIIPHILIPMSPTDLNYILLADAGDAEAQNDIGQLFSVAEKHDVALYWLQQAVQQDYADAMQWLGRCYLAGVGVKKDEYLGIMWIAKAASYGHSIAKAQMSVLRPI